LNEDWTMTDEQASAWEKEVLAEINAGEFDPS